MSLLLIDGKRKWLVASPLINYSRDTKKPPVYQWRQTGGCEVGPFKVQDMLSLRKAGTNAFTLIRILAFDQPEHVSKNKIVFMLTLFLVQGVPVIQGLKETGCILVEEVAVHLEKTFSDPSLFNLRTSLLDQGTS
ncbi:hypothetical protein [Pontibacter sp. HSC-36F09]|uniref:hypothetical protein n=1 Tax=Pontibacter sp. HSC-36F09 TaxID=2910966 RepID=UPI00209D2FB2|nr:hypothetical protein [Pontibacter sp. HSC-36F09]MCP2044225.1 hypothetical protein [Pontibacter sp. HSC-36F09]